RGRDRHSPDRRRTSRAGGDPAAPAAPIPAASFHGRSSAAAFETRTLDRPHGAGDRAGGGGGGPGRRGAHGERQFGRRFVQVLVQQQEQRQQWRLVELRLLEGQLRRPNIRNE